MKNNIIFFSIDRLGDYLIRSNVIKKISENYTQNEIICSDINHKLVSSQGFFSKIYLFDKKLKIKNKLNFIRNFFRKNYDAAIVFDGKNISNIILFFLKADFKYTFIYKKKGFLKKINFNFFITLLKILNIQYTILLSKDLINAQNKENYPNKYKELIKYYPNINNKTYYMERSHFKLNSTFNNYILFHFDEKLCDIRNINQELQIAIENLNINTEKKILITSFKNQFQYFKNLNFKKISFNTFQNTNFYNEKILIIENSNLNELINLIDNSEYNISCHGGFFLHASLMLKKNTLDIINLNQKYWLNTWISNTNNYKRVYKSENNIKKDIVKISQEISLLINEK